MCAKTTLALVWMTSREVVSLTFGEGQFGRTNSTIDPLTKSSKREELP